MSFGSRSVILVAHVVVFLHSARLTRRALVPRLVFVAVSVIVHGTDTPQMSADSGMFADLRPPYNLGVEEMRRGRKTKGVSGPSAWKGLRFGRTMA